MGLLFTLPLWENGKIFPAAGVGLIVYGIILVIAAIITPSLVFLLVGVIMVSSGVLVYHFGIQYVRKLRKEKEQQYFQWVYQYEQYMKNNS